MKSLRGSIFISLVATLGSFSLSGCYTQLAIGHDESAPFADSTAALNNQISGTTYADDPSLYAPAPPVNYYPLPFAGTSLPNTGTTSQSQSPHRESGYQRSATPAQNDNSRNQSATSQTSQTSGSNSSARNSTTGSDTRTSGTTRGGR